MGANAFKMWLIAGIAGLVALAGVLWLVLVGPEFDSGSSTRAAAADAAQQNTLLQRQVDSLRAQQSQLAGMRSQLDAARAAIPTVAGIDTFTVELSAAAAATHVTLTSVTIGSPAPLAGAPGAGTAATGIFTIAATVVTSGTVTDQLAFVHAVQNGARAALVNSTAFAPASGSGAAGAAGAGGTAADGSTLTLALTVFVDPASAPATPAPAATPSPAASTPAPTG